MIYFELFFLVQPQHTTLSLFFFAGYTGGEPQQITLALTRVLGQRWSRCDLKSPIPNWGARRTPDFKKCPVVVVLLLLLISMTGPESCHDRSIHGLTFQLRLPPTHRGRTDRGHKGHLLLFPHGWPVCVSVSIGRNLSMLKIEKNILPVPAPA